jgi:hypothetical protein
MIARSQQSMEDNGMRFSAQPPDDEHGLASWPSLPELTDPPVKRSGDLSHPRMDEPGTALQRLWGVWLRLTTPPLSGRDRESPAGWALARRRSLAAALLFGLLLLWTLLTPINIVIYPQDPRATALVIAIGYLTLASVGWLIRRGWVTAAATILIALTFGGFVAIQLSATNGALERSAAFYALLYPILLAAMLAPAEALFVTLAASLLLMGWSALAVWPASVRVESMAASLFTNVYIWPGATLIIVTIVAYIWTSGMRRATAQAEFAKLNALLSQTSETSARETLEHDARELLRVIDAWASDNLGAQAGPIANPDLRRVAIALTSYARRLRALAKTEFELQREREAVRRLAEAILYYRQGAPVAWPPTSGLPADLIIHAITTPDPHAALAELNLAQL